MNMMNAQQIKTAISKHQWAYAEKRLLKELKLSPNDLCVLELLLMFYWKKKDDLKALKVAKRMYWLEPNDPMILWQYGSCLYNVNRNKEAVTIYDEILNKRNTVLARHNRIRTLKRSRGFKSDVCVRIGECYLELRDFEAAIYRFEEYLRMRKEMLPSMYTNKEVKAHLKDALLEYLFTVKESNYTTYKIAEKAYATASNNPNVIWSFAACTNNMHKYQEAITLYKRLLRKADKTLAEHDNIRTLKKAKGFKLDVCVRIADCYMNAGDYKRAIPYIERYLTGKSKNIPTEYKIKEVKGYLRECESMLHKLHKHM